MKDTIYGRMGASCSGCDGCRKGDGSLEKEARNANMINRSDIDDAIRESREEMDTTQFQFNIDKVLSNDILKERTVNLCREKEIVVKHGGDAGFIIFIQKYMSSKTIQTVFTKLDVEEITNFHDLQSILTTTIVLYKAQVAKIKNSVFERVNNEKTPMNKKEFNTISNYLSVWIIRKYGQNDKIISIKKDEFSLKISKYLTEFIQQEYKAFDSMMQIVEST